MHITSEDRLHFEQHGFLPPMPSLLTSVECSNLSREIAIESQNVGHKSGAAVYHSFYKQASNSRLVDAVEALIGRNIMLWSASITERAPGAYHPWHSDSESWTQPKGKMVNVWIGLENTTKHSSLSIVSHSHLFNCTVQQMRHQENIGRLDLSDELLLQWARKFNPHSQLSTADMLDGDVFFFDSSLWHSSRNKSDKTRRALLLQYATPDTAIRIADLKNFDWPLNKLEDSWPECIMIRGADNFQINKMVAPPEGPHACPKQRISSHVHSFKLPLPLAEGSFWTPHGIFAGSCANVSHLGCHASALAPNHYPHPPHRHVEQEILVVLDGEVELLLPDLPIPEQRKRLVAGEFVYYPAYFYHTLKPIGNENANYLMFKWHSQALVDKSVPKLGFGQFTSNHSHRAGAGSTFKTLFEGATAYDALLHCHLTTLPPDSGYAAHADAHDIAIVLLEGEVETLGQMVQPHSVIFYAAGEVHGMRNSGSVTAKYIVFEFHRPKPQSQPTFVLVERIDLAPAVTLSLGSVQTFPVS